MTTDTIIITRPAAKPAKKPAATPVKRYHVYANMPNKPLTKVFIKGTYRLTRAVALTTVSCQKAHGAIRAYMVPASPVKRTSTK